MEIKVNASIQLHPGEKWLREVKVVTRKNKDSLCFLSRQSTKHEELSNLRMLSLAADLELCLR